MAIKFMIFITDNFLRMVNNSNDDIKTRCKYVVSINLFNYVILIFCILYMWLISAHILVYSQIFVVISSMFALAGIYVFLKIKYFSQYQTVIDSFEGKYSFSKLKSSLLFAIIFFAPILGIGFGISILRSMFYNIH